MGHSTCGARAESDAEISVSFWGGGRGEALNLRYRRILFYKGCVFSGTVRVSHNPSLKPGKSRDLLQRLFTLFA
jgi:hypothetical protein